MRVRVLGFDGKVFLDRSTDVEIPPLYSTVVGTYSRADLLKDTDAQHAFAVFDLTVDGKSVSSNVWLFDRTRNLALPSPSIQADLAGTDGVYTLRLLTPALARDVYVAFADAEVEVSDNYFDLLPNEPVVLQLKSKVTLEELREQIKVRNITDAFLAEVAKQ